MTTARLAIGVTVALTAVGCGGKDGSSKAQPSASQVEGHWETTVTRAQLLASNSAYGQDNLRSDAGDFQLTLHGRRFTFRHRSENGDISLHGTFQVRGNKLVLSFTSGSETGLTSVYQWSIYRDALRLRQAPGRPSWAFMTLTPWRLRSG